MLRCMVPSGEYTRVRQKKMKELYDQQEMAFLSNMGSLAEPLSKDQWDDDAGERRFS